MRLGRRGGAGAMVAGAAVASAALVALAACSGGGGGAASPTTAPATTGTAALTTVPAPTTTAEAITPQTTPDRAAQALLSAWRQGDRAGALHVASVDAVATLFGRPGVPYSPRGCQDPLDGRSACAFGVGGGLVQIQTTATLLGGWIVQSVTLDY